MLVNRRSLALDFTLTLPEDPYNVRRASENQSAGSGSRANRGGEFPDQRFLQFFTWKASFHIVAVARESPNRPHHGQEHGPDPTCSCAISRTGGAISVAPSLRILSGSGPSSIRYKCMGLRTMSLLVRPQTATAGRTAPTSSNSSPISEAKAFLKEEFLDWTYYIPKERSESRMGPVFLFFLSIISPLRGSTAASLSARPSKQPSTCPVTSGAR